MKKISVQSTLLALSAIAISLQCVTYASAQDEEILVYEIEDVIAYVPMPTEELIAHGTPMPMGIHAIGFIIGDVEEDNLTGDQPSDQEPVSFFQSGDNFVNFSGELVQAALPPFSFQLNSTRTFNAYVQMGFALELFKTSWQSSAEELLGPIQVISITPTESYGPGFVENWLGFDPSTYERVQIREAVFYIVSKVKIRFTPRQLEN